jgi:hypothetical protein
VRKVEDLGHGGSHHRRVPKAGTFERVGGARSLKPDKGRPKWVCRGAISVEFHADDSWVVRMLFGRGQASGLIGAKGRKFGESAERFAPTLAWHLGAKGRGFGEVFRGMLAPKLGAVPVVFSMM